MKRKLIALILSIVSIASVFAINTIPAYATTVGEKYIGVSTMFKDEWEQTANYKQKSTGKAIGKMIYGYDTDWVNEDYVWTWGYESETTALLKRSGYDESNQSGSKAASRSYSKCERKHQTYQVYYMIRFQVTYGETTNTVTSSSVKG